MWGTAPSSRIRDYRDAMPKDLAPVYARLRDLMAAAAPDLPVTADGEAGYSVDTGRHRTDGYAYQFGGVRTGSRGVSYHLLPVYYWPDLLDDVSPALRRRMQGKSCFTFTTVDEELLDELDALTRRGVDRLRSHGDDLPGQKESGRR